MLTDVYRNLLQGLIPDSAINVPRPLPNRFSHKSHIRSSIIYANEETALQIPRHKKQKPAVATSITIAPTSSSVDNKRQSALAYFYFSIQNIW
jgi:hypothetical protein